MTVNIITPIHNDAQNLLNTLNSVFEIKEKRPDIMFNYIIVDNLSTDNLLGFLKKHDNSKIVDRLIREKDRGIYDAMNKGLNICTDGHVLFLGAGDMIVTLPKILDENTIYYGTTIVHNSSYFQSTLDNCFTSDFGTIHHQSLLVPISFHRDFNLDYKICADLAHNFEMIIEGREFEFSSELLAYHMPGGVSSNLERVKEELKVIQQRARNLLEKGILVGRL